MSEIDESNEKPAGRFIPIARAQEILGVDEGFRLICQALEETAIVESLVLIHGHDEGYRRYILMGGHMGWRDGELVMAWPNEGVKYA